MLQPGLRNAKSRVKVATPSLKPRARTAFTYQKLKYCTTLRYQKKNKIFHWSQIRDKFAIVFNTQNYQLCDLILLRTNGPQVLLWRPLGIENQTAAHGAHVKLKSGSYMSFNHKLLPCGFFFIPKCIERLILFKLYYKIQFLITPVNFYYLKVRIIQHSNLSNN